MELGIPVQGHESCSEHQCTATTSSKCCVIGTSVCEPSLAIEDYYVYEINNVLSIGVSPRENYGWNVSFLPGSEGPPEDFYFCIDGIYHEAWSHWVDESAIYLPLFLKLKKLYPSLKLYSFGKKGYKNAMYKAFDISPEDIVYTLASSCNICFFPRYISLADHRQPFLFLKHAQALYSYLINKCPAPVKDIDILYLPRGSKENYSQNNRQIPVQSQLAEVLSTIPYVRVLFTDTIENMIDQFSLVRRAKVILLNEGSSLLVNGFFAVDSKIISLGGHGNNAHLWNACPALLFYDSICRGNCYYTIPYEAPVEYVLRYVHAVLEALLSPDPTPQYSCWRNCKYCRYQTFEKTCLEATTKI
jgi:hypothetical protein